MACRSSATGSLAERYAVLNKPRRPHRPVKFLHFVITLIVVLVLAQLALRIALVWPYTMDDTYIFLRYADNIAAGHGPVFNPGERAEGYTSPLWLAWCALAQVLRVDPVLFAKFSGVFFTYAAAFLVGATSLLLSRHLTGHAGAVAGAAFAMAAFAGNAATPVHAVTGMETASFLFFMSFAFWLAVRILIQSDRASLGWLPPAVLLLGLTRPEGNLLGMLLLASAGATLSRDARTRLLRATVMYYVAPGALYFAWRWNYYGLAFPLPFYAKTGQPADLPGLASVGQFWRDACLYDWPLLLALASFSKARVAFFTGILIAAVVSIFFLFVRDFMNVKFRYLYPSLALLLPLVGAGFACLIDFIERAAGNAQQRSFRTLFVLIVAIATMVITQSIFWRPTFAAALQSATSLKQSHVFLGRSLADACAESELLVAIPDAGAMPYYSRCRIIDYFSLLDPKLVRAPPATKSQRVLARKPDVLILTSHSAQDFIGRIPGEDELFAHALEVGFELVQIVENSTDYYLWIAARPALDLQRYLDTGG